MDRPPSNPGAGADRFPTDPVRPPPGAPRPGDPDPQSWRPELYLPSHGGPGTGDESMPTEPIPVLRPPHPPVGAPEHYEGDWADWVAHGHPDGPGGEYPAGPDRTHGPAADPAGHPPAHAPSGEPAEPRDTAPGIPAAEEPTTAQQRLRARLTTSNRTDPAPAPKTATSGGGIHWIPVLLGIAGAAALAAAVYVQFAVVGGGDPPAPARAAPSATAPATAAADPQCPAGRTGNSVQGNSPGSDDSGTDAIFGFQHAYYVARSGEQARALVAPDAAVPSAPDIQQGIDSIPAGTTYCVQIAPGAFVGQYTVTVTEYRPGSAPLAYNPQLVTTMRIGDKTLITGIGPMP
ncbi:hypothetical protein [Nocardia sp. NPDC024068]|uniref:hypothetical protein n=1 Tax=Nocardia sp. NPDC024068 TaxID=3157197 RepID=UPI0033E168CC